MIKKLIISVFAIGALVACNNQSTEEATAINTTEFTEVAGDHLDKTITIEGTVMHVCKHGGKKMFLNDDRVKVIASEKIASFDTELEGSTVIVKGIIREEAAPVLAENEQKDHAKAAVKVENATNDEAAAAMTAEGEKENCDFEAVVPVYVVEVVEVTEKIQ